MSRYLKSLRQHRIQLIVSVFIFGAFFIVTPNADAARDRGSIRNSNSASISRAGVGNPGGVRDPRGIADPRGVADPRGRADPRGVADPRGRADPRGVADPRGAYDSRSPYNNRYDRWEDARRDYYRYRTINHLLRLGAYYASVPRTSTTVIVTGTTYYYASGVYYVSSGTGYVVVSAPPTAVVYAVPTSTTVVYAGSTPYYYYGGTYYVQTSAPAQQPKPVDTNVNVNVNVQSSTTEQAQVSETPMVEDEESYEVVAPPHGVTVPYLPDEVVEQTVDGKKYYVYDDIYYRPFVSDGETIYMVVNDPTEHSG
jgi:hypothetical protein